MIFLIRDVRVSRMNLRMNDFVAGLPSPLVFLGLADSLIRERKLVPWSAKVIPVLHSVQVYDGRTKAEMTRKNLKFMPAEIKEDITGSVEFSLILNIDGLESELGLGDMIAKRLIGGGVVQNNEIKVEVAVRDGSAFRSLRRGFAMVRPDPENPANLRLSMGGANSLTKIVERLFPAERPQGYGWLTPVAAGYRLLEDPRNASLRKGVRRTDVPHVFSEPVLGIAEMISVRNQRLTDLDERNFASYFWKWSTSESFVLGHSVYFTEINTGES